MTTFLLTVIDIKISFSGLLKRFKILLVLWEMYFPNCQQYLLPSSSRYTKYKYLLSFLWWKFVIKSSPKKFSSFGHQSFHRFTKYKTIEKVNEIVLQIKCNHLFVLNQQWTIVSWNVLHIEPLSRTKYQPKQTVKGNK